MKGIKHILVLTFLFSFLSLIVIFTNESLFVTGEGTVQTSQTESLDLNTKTLGNGQRIQRVYAAFEWTEKRTAENEIITFTIANRIEIVPNTYQATILTKQNPDADWIYYSDAGGRPYQINHDAITWNWRGDPAYYKGYVSFLVDTEGFDSAKLNVDYRSGEQYSHIASHDDQILFTNPWY